MKFHIISARTQHKYVKTDITVRLGTQICGLSVGGTRPQSVTLDYEELKYLLQNPDYAIHQVLTALYAPRKEPEEVYGDGEYM